MTETLDKLISIKRVMAITGLSRRTIDRRERAGEFPRRIKDGEGRFSRVYWSQREILEWVAERKAARRPLVRTPSEFLALAHQPKRRGRTVARPRHARPVMQACNLFESNVVVGKASEVGSS